MADEPKTSGQEPNLELSPLLGFGRKKKGRKARVTPADPTPERSAPDTLDATEVAQSSAAPSADPAASQRGGLTPATEKAKRPPPVPPPTTGAASVGQVPAPQPPPAAPEEPAEASAPVLLEPPVAAPEAAAQERQVAPPPPDVAATGDTSAEHAEVVVPATGGPQTWARSGPGSVTQPVTTTEPPVSAPVAQSAAEQTSVLAAEVDEPQGRPVEEPTRVPATGRGVRGGVVMQPPVIDPRIAAVLTGAVVGLVGVVLAFLAGRGCEAVRGVGSCGGIGLFALLLIVAIEILIGAALLKAWRLYDPVSTSFLGVGLAAVFVLLFLISSLDSVLMVLVIPAISGIAFLISWWVTTSLVDGSA